MNVYGLTWGYGLSGYDVVARSPDLPQWVESLLLDIPDRFPFSEHRESLVLVRRIVSSRGNFSILLRSRLHLGRPVHRQTAMAMFETEELVAGWFGLAPMLACLPPYAPASANLAEVTLREDAHGEGCGGVPGVPKDWLERAWSRLAVGDRLELPSLEASQEMVVVDLLLRSLPPSTASRVGVALGQQRGGLFGSGPSIEGQAEETGRSRGTPASRPALEVVALEWVRRQTVRLVDNQPLDAIAAAIRNGLVDAARQVDAPTATVDLMLLDAALRREKAVEWLLHDGGTPVKEVFRQFADLLRDDRGTAALFATIRIRCARWTRPQCVAASERLVSMVEHLASQFQLAKALPARLAAALYDLDFGISGSDGCFKVPEVLTGSRIAEKAGLLADSVVVAYWALVGRQLASAIRARVPGVRDAYARAWREAAMPQAHPSPLQAPPASVLPSAQQARAGDAESACVEGSLSTTPLEGTAFEAVTRALVQVVNRHGGAASHLQEVAHELGILVSEPATTQQGR